MTQVIRVSKAGVNVGTASVANDFNYASDYNTLKYHSSGTINVVCAGTTAEGTVTHSLGYTPFFSSYSWVYDDPSEGAVYSMCPQVFVDAFYWTFVNTFADANKLYFQVVTNSAVGTFPFKYFIFRNNLGL